MRRCQCDSGFIRVVVIYITSNKLCGLMHCMYVAMNEITALPSLTHSALVGIIVNLFRFLREVDILQVLREIFKVKAREDNTVQSNESRSMLLQRILNLGSRKCHFLHFSFQH